MKSRITFLILVGAVTLLCLASASAADKGSGSVKIGYTFVDDSGSLALNQETYNTYEGLGLSLLDWRYGFDNGISLSADLNNITLNNRNLKANACKPGLFSLSFTNNQYRRFYDFYGTNFTRRATTGVQASFQPHRLAKFFAGFGTTQKHGNTFEVESPIYDTIVASTDYTNTSFNIGALVGERRASLRLDYRHFNFDDKTTLNADRKADNLSATATVLVPRFERLMLTGGIDYRKDKDELRPAYLETDQYWTAARLYLPYQIIADYRVLYAIAKHEDTTNQKFSTDHIVQTATVGKNWTRYGGLRVGYEYHIVDNFIDQTASSGILADAWLRPISRIYMHGVMATRRNTVQEGVTLLGDEDLTRHDVSIKYTQPEWGDVTARWQGRLRKNPDLNSRVDYRALTAQVNVERKEYGRLSVVWTYYKGQYKNESDNIGFEFGDHVLSGSIHPRTWRNFDVDFGATYYRSRRSLDIEKSDLNFGVKYTFLKNHHVEARYNVYNYDDYLLNNQYYTANIFEINIIKDLSF
jgi:hypothetical protein